MELKDRIAAAMKKKGMSQADLCKATGMGSSKVSQLLKGKTYDPRLSTAILLANALGVSLDWLAGREQSPAMDAAAVMDDDTVALLRDYEQCTPERRRTIAALTRDLRDQSKESAAASPSREEGAA